MASVNGGDVFEIGYSNDEVGSGVWYHKSNEDSTFDPGGFRNSDDDNMIDGGGRMIRQKNRIRWSYEGTVSWDANISNELDVVKQLCNSTVETEFTVSHSNGTVWKGKGDVVGDVKGNGNSATMAIKLAGGSEMTKIVG